MQAIKSNGDHHNLGFKLYFKGSVLQLEGEKGAKLGAIAFAIFDSDNLLVSGAAKPLVLMEDELTVEVAQLLAFIHGLHFALSLGINKVFYSCVDFDVDSFVQRKRINQNLRFLQDLLLKCFKPDTNQKPKDVLVAKSLDYIPLLKKFFRICHSSVANKENAQLVVELVRSSIAKQASKPVEEIVLTTEKCLICFDDVDSRKMFGKGCSRHRFCSSCMKMYVNVELRERKLPRCPEYKCRSLLSIDDIREFLTPESNDIMDQLSRKASIPATEKVYCPNPRCSYLVSKTEALATGLKDECRCIKCGSSFCVNCKVIWHSDMSCYDYKKSESSSDSSDAKLKLLAANKKWRQCPKCSHMVERRDGCKSISCRCGRRFCYFCRGRCSLLNSCPQIPQPSFGSI